MYEMVSENIFLELSKKVQNLGFTQSLIEISNIAFEEMFIDRITVWTFKDPTTIQCQFKGDQFGADFDCSSEINLVEYPSYFRAMLAEKIVVANDVFTHFCTFELTEYFTEHGILSTLDIPIFVDGLLFGLVCFDTTKKYANWSKDDIRFGSDVSQVISIAYISSKRNEDLKKLNAYAHEVKNINDHLKSLIMQKNEQFVEYGFINSHLLNAPLSRLKGLMNILVYELANENRAEEIEFITTKIYEQYDEMDGIVKKLTLLIDSGVSPNREKLD